MRRVALWCALLVALVAIVVSVRDSESNSPAARADRIAHRIACPVCVGETVAESNAEVSRQIRADIADRIKHGQSDQQILDYYARTEAKHLLNPSDSGLGLIAWGLPVAALVFALGTFAFAFARWRRGPRLEPTEAEREFLARSLDDLDAERADDGIDEATYARLHAEYAAQATAVDRALATGRDDLPKPAPIPSGRRWLAVAALVAFALFGAYSLSRALGTRAPGQTITGNTPTSREPRTYSEHLAAAGRFAREANWNLAAKEYLAAAKLEPKRAEPLAELAWLLIQQVGFAGGDPTLATSAGQLLDRAIAVDPTYADSYLYKGALQLTVRDDPPAAVPLLERYLELAPHGAKRTMAQQLLERARHPTTTTTTTSKP